MLTFDRAVIVTVSRMSLMIELAELGGESNDRMTSFRS
jgi:hypothetical protein